MSAEDTKYEQRTVRAIRGSEIRTIQKWESDGWETLDRRQGPLQTQLTFRRPKPRLQRRTILIAGALTLALGGIIAVGATLEGSDSKQAEAPARAAETTEPVPTATPTGAADMERPLTAEANEELALLLSGSDQGQSVEAFAANHRGQLIEFDGSIAAISAHGDYTTRYDILVAYGDYSETRSYGGPNFQLRDVSAADLHLQDKTRDSVRVGDNIRITARVGAFEAESLLFTLDPTSVRIR